MYHPACILVSFMESAHHIRQCGHYKFQGVEELKFLWWTYHLELGLFSCISGRG